MGVLIRDAAGNETELKLDAARAEARKLGWHDRALAYANQGEVGEFLRRVGAGEGAESVAQVMGAKVKERAFGGKGAPQPEQKPEGETQGADSNAEHDGQGEGAPQPGEGAGEVDKVMAEAADQLKALMEKMARMGGAPKPRPKGKDVLPAWFEKAMALAAVRKNILLVGPAGCGKTHGAKLLADALGLRFSMISLSGGTTEGQLAGRYVPVGAHGSFEFVNASFTDFYEHGGLFLIDEFDAGDANTVAFLNAALSNGFAPVPNRPDSPVALRHKDFACVAAANTYGRGADRLYVGRNELDEATLDRFRVGTISCDYDSAVEKALVRRDILKWGRGVRTVLEKYKVRRVVSTRFLRDLTEMAAAAPEFYEGEANWRTTLMEGWSEEEKARIPAPPPPPSPAPPDKSVKVADAAAGPIKVGDYVEILGVGTAPKETLGKVGEVIELLADVMVGGVHGPSCRVRFDAGGIDLYYLLKSVKKVRKMRPFEPAAEVVIATKSAEERSGVIAALIAQGYMWHGDRTDTLDMVEKKCPFSHWPYVRVRPGDWYIRGTVETNPNSITATEFFAQIAPEGEMPEPETPAPWPKGRMPGVFRVGDKVRVKASRPCEATDETVFTVGAVNDAGRIVTIVHEKFGWIIAEDAVSGDKFVGLRAWSRCGSDDDELVEAGGE